jgi:hypothetical protein
LKWKLDKLSRDNILEDNDRERDYRHRRMDHICIEQWTMNPCLDLLYAAGYNKHTIALRYRDKVGKQFVEL